MRDPDFFVDGDSKHFHPDCIGRFAANIKKGLNQAYGRQRQHNKRSKNTYAGVSASNNSYGTNSSKNIKSNSEKSSHVGQSQAREVIDDLKSCLLKLTEAFERAEF